MPQRAPPHRNELFPGLTATLDAAEAAASVCNLEGQRRVPMKWRGGFVPGELAAPARSLIPVRARSLGRGASSLVSFPSHGGEEKRRTGLGGLGLHQAGSTRLFSFRTEPRIVSEGASDRCPCRCE